MTKFKTDIYRATLYQVVVAILVLWLSRLGFYYYNVDAVGEVSTGHLWKLMWHGLRFDISAALYFNALFILLRFLPFDFVAHRRYIRVTNWIFYISNAVMLLINLGDIVFYQYGGTRLRYAAFVDMLNDPEIVSIFFSYFADYWWAFIGGLLLLVATFWLSGRAKIQPGGGLVASTVVWKKYSARVGLLLIVAAMAFIGMRGRVEAGRPLSIGDAAWGTEKNGEINIVLNSPFCVLRSLSGANVIEPFEFYTADELAQIRSSIHHPVDSLGQGLIRKNVVVITVESLGQMWLDMLNVIHDEPKRGLMPFLDSLATQSLVCTHTIATGRRSNEGANAVYGGFPAYEPFIYMLSPYNANAVDAAARLLKAEGYSTAFYFGGNHGSYSIDQLTYAMGFDRTVDRQVYGNDDDYDGAWGIFDHAMGEYVATDMSKMKEPFFTGWFTISNHGPFYVPSNWNAGGYRYSEPCVERSVEYTDRSLRHFFDVARRQSWYSNTLFIITGDHGCRSFKGTKYDTSYLQYHVPFIAYTPDGSIAPRRITDRVMSQIDINATILGLLNYTKPYISLGVNLLDDSARHYAITFGNNQFQVIGMKYLVQLSSDAKTVTAVYDVESDQQLTSPLTAYDQAQVDDMVAYCRAFLQDYSYRVINNKMSIENEK